MASSASNEGVVTVKEVAEVAGVHRATASKVLNNVENFKVSAATRRRILDSAAKLKFSLQNNFVSPCGVRTFGIVEVNVRYSRKKNPCYSDVYDGIDSMARKYGMNTYIINNLNKMNLMQLLDQDNFAGVIVLGGVTKELLIPFELSRKPLVGIESQHHISSSILYTIRTDSSSNTSEITRHLIESGHENIYYLGFHHPGGKENITSLERSSGVAFALKQAGLYKDDYKVLSEYYHLGNEEDDAIGMGYRAMVKLIQRGISGPLACVCYSDLHAAGAYKACREHNLKIPDDVSIVGYDNIGRSQRLDPPLTTINVPRFELGKRSVETLLEVSDGKMVNHESIYPSQLVNRESVLKR